MFRASFSEKVRNHLAHTTKTKLNSVGLLGFLDFSVVRTMEKSKKPSNPVCYTPLSEPFRIYLNSVAFSPHANYTDRATTALLAKLVPTFADRGYRVVSATDPPGR
jgi:hypothetical protein